MEGDPRAKVSRLVPQFVAERRDKPDTQFEQPFGLTTVSGYASKREVREVTEATLRMEGRDPAGYNVAGIMRDAFYDRGPGYGYGAQSAETWNAAVARHKRAARGSAGHGLTA